MNENENKSLNESEFGLHGKIEDCCEQLKVQYQLLGEALAAHQAAAAKAKAAKETVEEHQQGLNQLVRELVALKSGQYQPSLFDGAATTSAATDSTAIETVKHAPRSGSRPTATATTSTASDDEWRSVGIAALNMPGKTPQTLIDAGISTLGELADYTNAGKLLTDLKGIGEGKAEKILDALAGYWERPAAADAEPASEPIEPAAGLDVSDAPGVDVEVVAGSGPQ